MALARTTETSARTGEMIRTRRAELGLTQAQVSSLAGVSVDRIQQIENGKAQIIRAGTQERLEQALQLPRGKIREKLTGTRRIGGAGGGSDLTSDDIADNIQDLPPDVQDEIRRGIDGLPEVRRRYGHRAALAAMQHMIDLADSARHGMGSADDTRS